MNARFATSSFIQRHPKMEDDYFSSIWRQWTESAIRLTDAVLDRLERSREHAGLARMDGRELKDIGLIRSDIGQVMAARRRRDSL